MFGGFKRLFSPSCIQRQENAVMVLFLSIFGHLCVSFDVSALRRDWCTGLSPGYVRDHVLSSSAHLILINDPDADKNIKMTSVKSEAGS